MSLSVDKEIFLRRIRRIYTGWKTVKEGEEGFGSMDALAVLVATDDILYSKSTATQTWLLGYELTDTLLLVCDQAIYFLASKKKIDFLKRLESAAGSEVGGGDVPAVKLLCRDKNDKDKANFSRLAACIKESKRGKCLGVYAKDKFSGEFYDGWHSCVKQNDFETVDVSATMAFIMSMKEEAEVKLLRRASEISVDVFNKYLKEQIMDVIDSDKTVRHSKLADETDKAFTNRKYVPSGVDVNHVDCCYPTIIQSGGTYNLKFSVTSNKNALHFGSIICLWGARYKCYCSNVARTLLVNPTQTQQNEYAFLLRLFEHLVQQLRPGTRFCDVYEAVVGLVRQERPELVGQLTKNFGFVTGIEFRESSLLIGPKTVAPIRQGMVFIVALGIDGLRNEASEDPKYKTYSLMIGDTVAVLEDGPATVLTVNCKKKLKNIGIFLKDDDEVDSDNEKNSVEETPHEMLGRGKRTAVLENKLRPDQSADDKRRDHQKQLALQLNQEAFNRIKSGMGFNQSKQKKKLEISYRRYGEVPRETELFDGRMFVDKKFETVIIPVYGIPTPFHIATIKNISESVEGDYTYLRINFFSPGSSLGKENAIFPNQEAVFVKEITLRATNKKEPGELASPSLNLNTAFRLIKEVQKVFKSREAEDKLRSEIVKQEPLVLSSLKGNPKLKDLFMRPSLSQKRITGSLEAHTNGLRYTSVRGDKVDVLYSNVRAAFFQPCDHEMIILLHFHLHNAIMFGKKKHIDVQFYTEVGEITTDLGKHQHMHDRDDMAAEEAERELRHKLKSAFRGFADKVESLTKRMIEFDSPFRELGFYGCPFRSTVLLQPTSAALISLIESPPLVIMLDELELVHFERVQFHLKSFDIVFVFKDYTKKTVHINSVPMNLLDQVKEWLNSVDIRYTEGIQSLNWVKIMKTILDDPEGFFENGGWTFLDPHSGTDSEDSEETESEFKLSEDESGDEEGSEGEEEEESEYSEDMSDSDVSEELDDEESGKDWSELEDEAREDDKNCAAYQDEYSSGKSKSHHSHSNHKKHHNHRGHHNSSNSKRSPAKPSKRSHSNSSDRNSKRNRRH